VGWFGPRGLATIVFAIMVVDTEIADARTIAILAATTVIMSIVAHGISANRWAAGYGRRSGGS
jgi:NhaP-type Na+/H+ or K+/H+ antiporter